MRRIPLILFCVYLFVIVGAVAKAEAAQTITRHDRNVVLFFQHHPKAAATAEGGKILAKILPRLMRSLQAAQAASLQAAKTPQWPAHHALWGCIHGGEAGSWSDYDTGGNGHYGGLQMHPGWGYGTSYYASSDSQLTQEDAAEAGYAASGYSHAWLVQQWGETIGPCWGLV